MFETQLVIIGNVLTAPEWRRTSNENQLVANFKIASTARRFDRDNGRWTDGSTMRVRVTAWRKLAEGVASSVAVGDPVIVYGRIYTRDWVDEDKRVRVTYEMEAHSIGHDLSRGRGRFYRNKPTPAVSVIEGPDDDAIVGGEPAVPIEEAEVPVAYGEGLPFEESPPAFLEVLPEEPDASSPAEPSSPAEASFPVGASLPEEEGSGEEAAPRLAESRRPRRSRGREPVPA
ncbi:single-stranded DNA-binding protein [Actinoplanes sp. GCM10030250]|uniref:single-stranded DNA-binding protein n=1 Tax=Actinoplanes sp. GCM10030250 TaxID=3273376 RepID=UPI0036091FBB